MSLGPFLPMRLHEHNLVASMDKQFLYAIVNGFMNENSGLIFKLSCCGDINKCEWTKITTRLNRYGSMQSVPMTIPNTLADILCTIHWG